MQAAAGIGSGSPIRFQIFQPQFQLIDVLSQFLRTGPKLHPLQLQDQQLQIFDFVFVGNQFGLVQDQFGVLFNDQRFQRIRIQSIQIRKYCVYGRHATHSATIRGQLRSQLR